MATKTLVKTLHISSPAFDSGESIPPKYTCDGEDISPALEIGELPEGTSTLALIVEDPDAPRGNWTHWLMWDIPPTSLTGYRGHQRFWKHQLRRSLPTYRHTSLLLQGIRLRYQDKPAPWQQQRGISGSYAEPYHRLRGTDGLVQPLTFFNAINSSRKTGGFGLAPSSHTLQHNITAPEPPPPALYHSARPPRLRSPAATGTAPPMCGWAPAGQASETQHHPAG